MNGPVLDIVEYVKDHPLFSMGVLAIMMQGNKRIGGGEGVTYTDVTDGIKVYEKGKTWDCVCGHGIGTKLDTSFVKCAKCGTVLHDHKFNSRESMSKDRQAVIGEYSTDEDQTALEEFL